MMYSVVSNPSADPDFTRVQPRAVETGNALSLLTDRQFHMCGENTKGEIPLINAHAGGAFLVGAHAPKRLTALRAENPSIPLIVEPEALTKHWASKDEPFHISTDPNDLFPMSLDADLDLQRMRQSDLAITPTGQIKAGESATLKAALEQVNKLTRTDVLFALPLAGAWLDSEQHTKQLIAVMNRSNHPVLLMFTSSDNPVKSDKRRRAYRRIISNVTVPVVSYRTDLQGFDAVAHGAIASAIGSYPSMRRLNRVGTRGHAADKETLSPHMLITDMLKFVRSTHLRRNWFAEAEPLQCFCVICRGGDIDRLHGSDDDRNVGHGHNVVSIDNLYSSYVGLDPLERQALWARQTAGALDTYPQLETHLKRAVGIPPEVEFWAS